MITRPNSDRKARPARRAFFLALPAVALACSNARHTFTRPVEDTSGGLFSAVEVAARLDLRGLREASGLARSHRRAERLWTLNDGDGGPVLYAFGTDGSSHGRLELRDAVNRDWEDLASFERGGRPWLLVADVGDNDARRDEYTLYLVEEPLLDEAETVAAPERVIRFRYPEGAMDCESVAVDLQEERILLLSKRSVPAVLYSLPLFPDDPDTTIVAERLGDLASVPQPTKRDIELAPIEDNWHWQPTAMDIAPAGDAMVILTYAAAWYLERSPGEEWIAAVRRSPLRLDLAGIGDAEAVTFDGSGRTIYVTVEGPNPPLLRFRRHHLIGDRPQ